MSFVLDALRKSEHERQRLTGKTSSILYPVVVDDNRMFRLWTAMVGGAVLAMILLLSLWWLWPSAPQEPEGFGELKPVAAPAIAPAPEPSPPAVKPVARPVAPPPAATPAKRTAAAPAVKPAPPARSAAAAKPVAAAPAAPAPKPPAASDDDPLKDLPPLEISGYLHDEQTGNLAIVNNKLVHEGEEVAPGLVLEKIQGDSALFSYRGHQFRR